MTTTATEKTSKGSARKATAAKPETTRPATIGRPTKSRRRTWIIALGIAIILIGGLFTWYLTTQTSQTVSVLTTNTAIERGDIIEADDLTTISLAGGQDVDAFAANEASEVIGQVAAMDLPAGALLSSTSVVDTLLVPPGDSIVGIALNQSQLPSHPLSAGDQVRLVDTPVAQGEPPTSSPETFDATVFTTKFDETNQVWIIDLVVPTNDAADIAARAATQRVSIILDAVGE